MSLLVAWIAYPLVLAALCAGLGLLVDLVAGRHLPGALVLPTGLAAMIVVGGFTTASEASAELTVPVLVGLAVAGAGLALPSWRFGRPDPWPTSVAVAVFLVFGAPVFLSGEPTFAGYIKLDDTATWLAITDRIMEHGRDIAALEPSTYRSTLDFNLAGGYPIGVFVPFGTAQRLVGVDLAWVFQPYVSFLAAMTSLGLWQLFGELLGRLDRRRPRWRAGAAVLAAQPALLYGYALWGGVKEVAAAALLPLAAALAPAVVRGGSGARQVIPLALVAAALVGVLSPGGAAWMGPLLAALLVLAYRRFGPRGAGGRAALFTAVLAVLVAPALLSGIVPPTSKPLVGSDGEGNLRGPLNVLQALGIWPTGDFRFDPDAVVASTVLIGLGIVAALAGLWAAWRQRALGLLLLASALFTSAAIVIAGSPWAAGKALATISPAILALAVAGALACLRLDRVAGAILAVAIAFGVLWSNALAYHDVSLAPYEQLRELEEIGEEHGGEGPALITEYQPYGARHFLRELDAEGASELRFRPVTLAGGGTLERGEWADTDAISLDSLLTYRTLILRRGPLQSRPPSSYVLAQRGEYYDVWRRPLAPTAAIAEHLPLGDERDPGAVPACSEVRRIAAVAGPGGTVAAVRRAPNLTFSMAESEHPSEWVALEPGGPALVPSGAGTARFELTVPRPGRYDLFLEGGTRNRLSLALDGVELGSVTTQRSEESQFLHFGRALLRAGTHRVALVYAGPSLAPGSGGDAYPIGPLVLSPATAEEPPLLRVPASRAAARLCGERLDWLEALPRG